MSNKVETSLKNIHKGKHVMVNIQGNDVKTPEFGNPAGNLVLHYIWNLLRTRLYLGSRSVPDPVGFGKLVTSHFIGDRLILLLAEENDGLENERFQEPVGISLQDCLGIDRGPCTRVESKPHQ